MHLLIIAVSLFTSTMFPSDQKDDKKSEFVDFIEQISLVKEVDDMKPLINPEAYLAFDSKYESYYEVLSNDEYSRQVNDELCTKVNVARSQVDDDSGAGYIFLTGVSKSGENVNHTFCVKIDKEGKWKIIHWHVN